MDKVDISVVIPAFNEEHFISHLLKSLKQQQFTGTFEIVVVDNNCTDKTASIAKSFGARIVPEKTQGYAAACNKGFYSAKASIIARADADYVLPPDWLQKIWNTFEKDKNLVATGGPIYPLETTFIQNLLYYPACIIWMHVLKFVGRGFLFTNMAVRTAAFYKTGGFNTKIQFGEDTDMCLRLVKVGKVSLNPTIYLYTSMRRVNALGFIKFVFVYSLWNEIAKWRGKKISVGFDPIRDIPKQPYKLQNPLIYLILGPSIFIGLIIVLLSFAF